jgi:pimeloyl-ACP methyl ester carboxylesterase
MPFGYKELVEDVEELVERLGFEHFFHAGHSMGGRIALEHALTYPDRVAGIAVISARAQAPDAADRERLRALIAACEDEGSAAAVSGWASEGSEEYERVRSISADNPVRGTVAALEVLISAQSLVPRLVDIDIPTLVVAGACDGRYTRSAEEMAMAIPDSLLCILEGVGHFPNIECAEILAGELTTFFTAVNARGKGRL